MTHMKKLAVVLTSCAVTLGGVLLSSSAEARSADRLVVTEGGTPDDPKVYSGDGAAVDGITVEADNVIVEDYVAEQPEAPGVEIFGDNVTIQNVTVTDPQGGDGDGVRFFGDDLKILNNTIRGTDNDNGHADCMQTFSDDTPPSQNVLIEGNRCEQIDNMCLMAEGPNDGEGDGVGHSSDFTIRNNFCETLEASQHLMIEDVQDVVIADNEFAGPTYRAIGLAINSTGAHVGGSTLNPDIECEVGIDESSMDGYEGPEPGCEP
ncbi:MAG: right-handed parallel beta-helix repeat-containing protein [Stackebrandtia sp.]